MDPFRPGADVTIGRPTPNNSVYVLDDELRPLPLGEVGIMWAGGLGVSLGYLNLPEVTSKKYRPDPFRADGYVSAFFSLLPLSQRAQVTASSFPEE